MPVPTPTLGVGSIPTTLDIIGEALRTLLVTAGVAPSPAAVIFSRKPQPFPACGYPQVVIARTSFSPVADWFEGGGRRISAKQGTITLTINTLMARDQAEQDRYRLNGVLDVIPVVPGLEIMAHTVADALHGNFLTDATGHLLTVEPVHLVSDASPEDYGETNPGWEGITLGFRLTYLPSYVITANSP